MKRKRTGLKGGTVLRIGDGSKVETEGNFARAPIVGEIEIFIGIGSSIRLPCVLRPGPAQESKLSWVGDAAPRRPAARQNGKPTTAASKGTT